MIFVKLYGKVGVLFRNNEVGGNFLRMLETELNYYLGEGKYANPKQNQTLHVVSIPVSGSLTDTCDVYIEIVSPYAEDEDARETRKRTICDQARELLRVRSVEVGIITG